MKIMRIATWMVTAMLLSSFLIGSLPVAHAQSQTAVPAIKPVNINKASAEEFQQVRGIGPALAERIISYRESNGGFKSLDEMKEIKGIGDLKFEKIKSQLTM